MIILDYKLSKDWNINTLNLDLTRIDKDELLYGFFLGDVIVVIKNIDFSTSWGWVPILDFSRGFLNTVKTANETGEGIFEFTESEAQIKIIRRNKIAIVSSSYQNQIAEIPFSELLTVSQAFFGKVLQDLFSQFPSLKSNTYFLEIFHELDNEQSKERK